MRAKQMKKKDILKMKRNKIISIVALILFLVLGLASGMWALYIGGWDFLKFFESPFFALISIAFIVIGFLFLSYIIDERIKKKYGAFNDRGVNELIDSSKGKSKKYNFNQAQIIGFGGMGLVFGLLILWLFASVGWDVNAINFKQFLSRLAILVFLAIYGLPAGVSTIRQHYVAKVNSSLNQARNKFLAKRDEASKRHITIYFPEYLEKYWAEKRKRTYERIIASAGIKQAEVLQLTENEVESLVNNPISKRLYKNSDETCFLPITRKQADLLLAILRGEVEVETFDASYYLNEANEDGQDPEAKAKGVPTFKQKNTASGFAKAFGRSIIIFIILAGFVYELINQDDPKAVLDAIANFIQRMFALFSSLYSGGGIELKNISADIYVYDVKAEMWDGYISALDNEQYIPENISEKAKRMLHEYNEKKKLEEATAKAKQEMSIEKPKEAELPKVDSPKPLDNASINLQVNALTDAFKTK
jgi:hypothetical protein